MGRDTAICSFLPPDPGLQGAKREREVSPSPHVSPEAQAGPVEQTGPAAPPAKRIRAPTAVSDPTSIANQDPQQATLVSMSQKPAEDKQAQTGMPGVAAPLPTSAVPGQAGVPSAALQQQQHTARVAVMQQDPERVQVSIEMPTSVVQLTPLPAAQAEVAQPAATTGETADVDMAEGSADAAPDAAPDAEKTEPDAARTEAAGEDAEDGELPDADAAAAVGEIETPGTQLQASPAAGSSAAAAAGQGAASDADGNPGRTGRKPIVFDLAPGGASEPSAPVTGSQPQTGGTPASGTSGTVVDLGSSVGQLVRVPPYQVCFMTL